MLYQTLAACIPAALFVAVTIAAKLYGPPEQDTKFEDIRSK